MPEALKTNASCVEPGHLASMSRINRSVAHTTCKTSIVNLWHGNSWKGVASFNVNQQFCFTFIKAPLSYLNVQWMVVFTVHVGHLVLTRGLDEDEGPVYRSDAPGHICHRAERIRRVYHFPPEKRLHISLNQRHWIKGAILVFRSVISVDNFLVSF